MSNLCAEGSVVSFPSSQTVSTGGGVVELGRRLLAAAREGDTDQVRELMALGAPFTADWLGTSPLHLAAVNGHADTCAVLLRAGISRDTRTKVDRTPLHLAAYAGHARVAALLLEAGAAADCRDMLRMTPLHWAVERGHTEVARELLARGADANASSKFLKTPLSIARELAREDLLEPLERAVREREAAEENEHEDNKSHLTVKNESGPTTTDERGRCPAPARTHRKGSSAQRPVEGEAEAAAAQLLRSHGITMLPPDDGNTVLSALQSGRTVVLSDAGKLMLKESESSRPPAPPRLTKPFKIVTLEREQVSPPAQVNYIHVQPDAKTMSPVKSVHIKPKVGVVKSPGRRGASVGGVGGSGGAGGSFKIYMSKTYFGKLAATADQGSSDSVVHVPEEFLRSSDPQYLRMQLLAAHANIARLRSQLRAAHRPA